MMTPSSSSATTLRRLVAHAKPPILLRCFTSSSILAEQKKKEGDAAAAATTPLGVPYDRLTVGIPKETFPRERRVAATPESVARLVKPGFSVQVEDGAGLSSYFSNEDYHRAGATIVDSVWRTSDIVLKVGGRIELFLSQELVKDNDFLLSHLVAIRRSGLRLSKKPRLWKTGRSSVTSGPSRTRPSSSSFRTRAPRPLLWTAFPGL
jgi:NAD(P) transhydrogenase